MNLETRVKNGFTNAELDELYVFNEKGKRMTINTIMDPPEGLVYYFFMEGERAYVFNTFKLPEEPTAINGLQADDEDGDTYDLSGRAEGCVYQERQEDRPEVRQEKKRAPARLS